MRFSRFFKTSTPVVLLLLMLGACSSQRAESIAIENTAALNQNESLRHSLIVENVEGAASFLLRPIPAISNEEFKEALTFSLTNNGLAVVEGQPAKFSIDASINMSASGAAWEHAIANAEVKYIIKRLPDHTVLLEKKINSTSDLPPMTDSMWKAFLAISPAEAQQLHASAYDMAASQNILKFLELLSKWNPVDVH